MTDIEEMPVIWVNGEAYVNRTDLRAALAQPEPLDVERLARALDKSVSGVTGSHADALAARIAAEYARLSETPR